MKTQNKLFKALLDLSRKGHIKDPYIAFIRKADLYNGQQILSTFKGFVKAFRSRKTSDVTRHMMIISTFLFDKEILNRRLKSKTGKMYHWISPVYIRQGRSGHSLSHFEIRGLSSRGTSARIPLDPGIRNLLISTPVPAQRARYITALVKNKTAPGVKMRVLAWVIECEKHLTSILWLLHVSLKMFDRQGIIIYPVKTLEELRAKPAYEADQRRINLHGFPQHIRHYINYDWNYKKLYELLEVIVYSLLMDRDLNNCLDIATKLEAYEYESAWEAQEALNELVIAMAEGTKSTFELLEALMESAQTIWLRKHIKSKDVPTMGKIPSFKFHRNSKMYNVMTDEKREKRNENSRDVINSLREWKIHQEE